MPRTSLISQPGLQYDRLAAKCKSCGSRLVVLANLRGGLKLATCPNLQLRGKDPRAADHSRKRKDLKTTGCRHAGETVKVDMKLQDEAPDVVFDWGEIEDDS